MGDFLVPHPHAGARDIQRFLDVLEARLARLDRAIMLAEWALYTGRSAAGSEPQQLARAKALGNPRLVTAVRAWTDSGFPGSLGRRVELLRRAIVEAQVEQSREVLRRRTRLQSTIVRFRPTWEGKKVNRVVVSEVLRKNPEVGLRKKAFYAEDELYRSIGSSLRELIALRNDAARGQGFRSFPEMRLEFEGLTVARLQSLIGDASAPAESRIRSFRDSFLDAEKRSEWFPWDLNFARFRIGRLPDKSFPGGSMVGAITAALRQWGFPAPRLKFRVVRHDLPFGGLTVVPAVPTDVRILVHPRGGWEYFSVLFHEFGHAVHARSVRQPTHLLRSADQGFAAFFEGIADLFEEISVDAPWLARQPGISPAAARQFREGRGDENLLRATGMGRAVLLELELYKHPDRDPTETFHRAQRRLFGYGEYVPRPIGDTFHVTHPIYTQSYLLSLLFRKQVRKAMLRDVGPALWPNRKVAAYLSDRWFRHGARYDWIPRVAEVTGEPFGPKAFAESVRRREP